MKKILFLTVSVCLLSVFSDLRNADGATLTADNHYALYVGNQNGVRLIGANESGQYDSNGKFNWAVPETFTFDMNPEEWLYVAAWDNGLQKGLIGQFVTDSGTLLTDSSDWEVSLTGQFVTDSGTLLTDSSDWEVSLTHKNLGGDVPTPDGIKSDIVSSVWNPVANSIQNGSGVWGAVNGISRDAQWIWGSAMYSVSSDIEYQLFRTRIETGTAATPEPASLLLLCIGAVGLAVFRKKSYKR